MWPLSVSPCGIETERSIGARMRERERPLHRLLRVSSVWPRMRVGLSLQFSRLGRRSFSLAPITIPLSLFIRLSVSLSHSVSLPSLPRIAPLSLSLSVCPSVRLSLALFCRSIPSRRTFKCHQPDREVGLDVSLYRVCLKCLTSARVPLTGKKRCRVKIRRCYWGIYLLKRVSVLKLLVLWENLIDIFLLFGRSMQIFSLSISGINI